MTVAERRLPTALLLPTYAQDFDGATVLCAERGVDAYTPWTSTGGQWLPKGPSYVGVMSGLPAAANVRVGTRAIIDETAAAGLTRPPTVGVKMNRVEMVVRYLHDGTTKVWRPNGAQMLYQFGGINSSPVKSRTAAAAAELLCEFGQIPAGLLNVNGMELFFRAYIGRTAPNVGTADLTLLLSPTSGTTGTQPLGVCAAMAATATSTGWIEGSMFVADATHQTTNYTVTPGGKANVSTNASTTLDLTVAQTLQIAFASATTGDTFNLLAVSVGIR